MRYEKLKQCTVVIVFFLIAILFFKKVIFTGREIVLSNINCDTALSYYWWRKFAFGSLAKGVLPLWNPYVFCGQPFIAGLQSAVFYLPNLIFFFLPTYAAVNYTFIIHTIFSGLMTYLFVRYLGIDRFSSLLSGIVYSFSALFLLHIYAGHLNDICTLSWVPALFLFLEKALRTKRNHYFLASGFILAIQILAGHPQYVFYTLIGLTLYFVLRNTNDFLRHALELKQLMRRGAMFVLFVIIGFSLAAVQLIPAIELLNNSVRGGNLNFQWCGSFSFPPENLITFIVPGFFGDLVSAPYWGRWYLWETCGYVGILPLILCLMSILFRRKNEFIFIFGFIALTALVLSFGKYTPIFALLYRFIPGFNLFRGNAKFIFLTIFSLAVLCGFGSNFLIKNIERKEKARLARLIWAMFILSLIFIIGIQFLFLKEKGIPDSCWLLVGKFLSLNERYIHFSDFSSGDLSKILFCAWKGIWISILFILLSGYVLFLRIRKKINLTWFKIFVFLIMVIDLLIFGTKYVATFDPQTLRYPGLIREFLRLDPGIYRIGCTAPVFLNEGVADGIFNIGGYEPNVIRRYNDFINFSQGLPKEYPNLVVILRRYTGLLNLLNLKYIFATPDSNINTQNLRLLIKNSRINIYVNPNLLPRAFIVGKAKVIKDKEVELFYMSSGKFDPRKEVILEEDFSFARTPTESVSYGEAEIIDYQPNAIMLKVDLPEPGWLVLSEVWYPGWDVYIDDKEDKIYRVNYILRGVYLDKGKHSVRFVYRPPSAKFGLIISLSTLSLLITIFIIRFIHYKIRAERWAIFR